VDERGHPSWCTAAGLSDRTTCGGQHISDSTDIPALGGPWTLTDGGGDIARAQVCLTHDADTGRTAIEVMVADSNVSPLQRDWIAASLDPAGAEQLAAALIAYAHQARQPVQWTAPSDRKS
jgi:hypothetical protein